MSEKVYTEEEFLPYLKSRVEAAGGPEKFCLKHSMRPHFLEDILSGAMRPPAFLAGVLGYKRAMVYIRVEET